MRSFSTKNILLVFILFIFSFFISSCADVLNNQIKTGLDSSNINDATFYVNNTKPVNNSFDGWKVLYLKSGELLSFSNYIEQGEYYIYFSDSSSSSFNSTLLKNEFKKTINEKILVSNDDGDVSFDSQKNTYKSFEVKEPGTYNIKIQNKSSDGYCAFYIFSDDGKAFYTDPDKESGEITKISDFHGTYNYKKGRVYLSWKSTSHDSFYYIYRGNQYIGKSNALSFTDSGIMADNSYTYEIKNGTTKSAMVLASYKINTGKNQANYSDSSIDAILYEEYSKNYWLTLEKGKSYQIRWGDKGSKDTEVTQLMSDYNLGDFVMYIYDPDGNLILTIDDNQTEFSVEKTGDYSITIESKDNKVNSYCGYLICLKE